MKKVLTPENGRSRTRPTRLPTSKPSTSKGKSKLDSPIEAASKRPKIGAASEEITKETPQSPGYVYNVKVNNSFESLSTCIDEYECPLEANAEATNIKSKIKKIPPIIIHGHLDNPGMFFKKVNDITSTSIDIKCTRNKTIFLSKSESDHKRLSKFLEEKNVPFHTYPLPGEGLTKLVLKGLSNGVTIEDIFKGLEEKNFPPTKIIQLKRKGSSQLIPLFICLFPPEASAQEILKINRLCYTCVSWSKYKNNAKVIQCYRCLEFGHFSNTCFSIERCLKCGENHRNDQCMATNPRCANCNQSHRANSEECPVLIRAAKRREEQQRPRQRSSTPAPAAQCPPTGSRDHYPSLPSNSRLSSNPNLGPTVWPQPPQMDQMDIAGLIQRLLNFLKNPNIFHILNNIIKILQTLCQADGASKWQIIFDQILSLFK